MSDEKCQWIKSFQILPWIITINSKSITITNNSCRIWELTVAASEMLST